MELFLYESILKAFHTVFVQQSVAMPGNSPNPADADALSYVKEEVSFTDHAQIRSE